MANSTKEQERLLAEKDYIITALCEESNRCSICYDTMTGDSCDQCGEYYSECICKPLTPKQITDDDVSPCPSCGADTRYKR